MSADDPLHLLERHLTRCAAEYLACATSGDLTWTVHDLDGTREGYREIYEVDDETGEGPIVMVRASDGARVEVDVYVTVGLERTTPLVQNRTRPATGSGS